jgi:hypothetical protein
MRRRLLGSGLPPDEQVVALDQRHRELREAAEAVVDAYIGIVTARYNNEARRAGLLVEKRIEELAVALGRNVDRSAVRAARGRL